MRRATGTTTIKTRMVPKFSVASASSTSSQTSVVQFRQFWISIWAQKQLISMTGFETGTRNTFITILVFSTGNSEQKHAKTSCRSVELIFSQPSQERSSRRSIVSSHNKRLVHLDYVLNNVRFVWIEFHKNWWRNWLQNWDPVQTPILHWWKPFQRSYEVEEREYNLNLLQTFISGELGYPN